MVRAHPALHPIMHAVGASTQGPAAAVAAERGTGRGWVLGPRGAVLRLALPPVQEMRGKQGVPRAEQRGAHTQVDAEAGQAGAHAEEGGQPAAPVVVPGLELRVALPHPLP